MRKKKLTYIYLQIIIQFQNMLFKLNICKVLTNTTTKTAKQHKNHILETAANIKFTYKLVNWKTVNDKHCQLAMTELLMVLCLHCMSSYHNSTEV